MSKKRKRGGAIPPRARGPWFPLIKIMKNTTHTRISSGALAGLDFLCGQTGDNRRNTIDRVVVFAIKELSAFKDRAKYQEVLKKWGEPTRSMVTK